MESSQYVCSRLVAMDNLVWHMKRNYYVILCGDFRKLHVNALSERYQTSRNSWPSTRYCD